MAGPGLRIRVDTTRGGVTISYSTTGLYRSLSVNDVRHTAWPSATPPGSGSKAYWEAVLNAVLADIIAGNGGGT